MSSTSTRMSSTTSTTQCRRQLAKLGLSVSLFFWLFVSFVSAGAAIISINYAKKPYKFKLADFSALVQKSSFILNIYPLVWSWKKYNVKPSWPTKFEFVTYTFLGIVGAFETYLKAKAQILLPGSTYLILFESDLIWNVLLSVTFLRRCYHPLQFLSPVLIFGASIMVSFSSENTGGTDLTGMGQFGGVALALGATFLTAFGAILSDKILKIMMRNEVLERHKQSLISDINEADINQPEMQEELIERNMSKIWYQNKEQIKNFEFTFWSSFLAFLWLIVWTFVDPDQEYKDWPKEFNRNFNEGFAIACLMTLLAVSRLFVRLSMTHILMVLSAFFFSVWKPVRRIGTEFISIALFDEVLDVYKGISMLMDILGFSLFVWGAYLLKEQKKREKERNTTELVE